MVASSSNGNGNGNGGGAGGCAFSSESLGREPSRFSSAVQRVEAALASIHGINERISALAEQRRKLYDEVRGIQGQINEEFERVLSKSGKSGGPSATKVVARAVKVDAVAAALKGEDGVVARLPVGENGAALVRAEM